MTAPPLLISADPRTAAAGLLGLAAHIANASDTASPFDEQDVRGPRWPWFLLGILIGAITVWGWR